jgi:anaerobic magnesium-protoporphyrin IX monomethyl ester cyclase
MASVALIRPNNKASTYQNLNDLSAIEPPLWMAMRAAHLIETGYDVKIVDEEVACLNGVKTDFKEYFPIGNHPSSFVQQYIESECTVWDTLPYFGTTSNPAWHLFNLSKYRAHNWQCWGDMPRTPYGVVHTSIGCPFKCSFCCIKGYYNDKYEQRPIDLVLQDLIYLSKKKVVNIKIIDELFIFDKKRVKELCEGIIRERLKLNIWCYSRVDTIPVSLLKLMKKAGINWICLGIESGNEKIRTSMEKGKFSNIDILRTVYRLHRHGIHVLGNFMFGFPDDNEKTMEETFNLSLELKCEYANFYCVVAYPNTKLYDYAKSRKWDTASTSIGYAQYSPDFRPLRTNYLTWKQVRDYRDKAFLNYYNDKSYRYHVSHVFGSTVLKQIDYMLSKKIIRCG